MISAITSLIKNLILIGIVLLSLVNFFTNTFNWKDLLAIQSITGLGYVFLSCYEYLNASYKATLPIHRYPYFTSSFIMYKVLKICLFFLFAILLYTSGSRIKYLYPICLVIALTETIITILKYSKSLCFVNIYANYLLIAQTKLTKLFATEILIIEFRHDIFYFVKKDTHSIQIKLEHIHEKKTFIIAINNWAIRNKVPFSVESKQKIETKIA